MRLIIGICTSLWLFAGAAFAQGDLLESRESVYNNIYVFKRGDLVIMQFGRNSRYWTESVYDTRDDRALPVFYTRYLTAALAYPKSVDSVLEIGLGGGRTAAYLNLHMPKLSIRSVELDPEVIDLAITYFGLKPNENFQISAQDGRLHLMRDRTAHD
ncbi:MAG: spermidine synthase, partial [Pseudomonadota bacterium]